MSLHALGDSIIATVAELARIDTDNARPMRDGLGRSAQATVPSVVSSTATRGEPSFLRLLIARAGGGQSSRR